MGESELPTQVSVHGLRPTQGDETGGFSTERSCRHAGPASTATRGKNLQQNERKVKLDDKVAVVTRGGQGLGRGIALGLSIEGEGDPVDGVIKTLCRLGKLDRESPNRPTQSNRLEFGPCRFPDSSCLAINGYRQYLWRAVDQDGDVLDILVQKRRDK